MSPVVADTDAGVVGRAAVADSATGVAAVTGAGGGIEARTGMPTREGRSVAPRTSDTARSAGRRVIDRILPRVVERPARVDWPRGHHRRAPGAGGDLRPARRRDRIAHPGDPRPRRSDRS